MCSKNLNTDSCLGSRAMKFYTWFAKLWYWFIVGAYGVANRYVYFSPYLDFYSGTNLNTDSCLGSRSMRFYMWFAKLWFLFIVGVCSITNRYVYFYLCLDFYDSLM